MDLSHIPADCMFGGLDCIIQVHHSLWSHKEIHQGQDSLQEDLPKELCTGFMDIEVYCEETFSKGLQSI